MLQEPSLRNLTKKKFGRPPKTQNFHLADLGEPHTSSFNNIADGGLDEAIANLHPVEFTLPSPSDDRVRLQIVDAHLDCPKVPLGALSKESAVYPSECRQRGGTYKGKLTAVVRWALNGNEMQPFTKDFGDIPIMVKSNRCHLHSMSPKELVKHQEHEQEWGGYFIIKGHERLMRMLLMTRRNYPVAIKRPTWKMRGALFSEYGVSVRCVMNDETSTTNVLHFVTDGSAKLMFSHRKMLFYIPLMLILKCLCPYSDRHIYKKLMQGYEDDLYYSDSVQNMLRMLHQEGQHDQNQCKNYLGKLFRVKFLECPPWKTDTEITDFIIKHCILIHLEKPEDKFNLLAFMTRKLFVLAQEQCKVEGADAVMMQELLIGGHLYLQVLKQKFQSWLVSLRFTILKRVRSARFTLSQSEMLTAAKYAGHFENSMEAFLATGNLTAGGLGLMQDKGLTIVPENINRMRYMSHFKAVHRGSFFQEMRTTEARQLLPDAWGFICPVHTPDGAPCGLLNHLAMNCRVTVVADRRKVGNIPMVLAEHGMVEIGSAFTLPDAKLRECYVVQLDGRVLGYVHSWIVQNVVDKLRALKVEGELVPSELEIVLVPLKGAQYPGLFLFTGPARMMRPLLNLALNRVEMVGTFEQVYLDVCVTPNEAYAGITTHMELSKTGFLSNLAHLIPMPDCNQSPRNMYQCQMGKQTMGTPCHNWGLQAETKLYRLQTPASPLFRPVHYDNVRLDDFPMGTNAIVAVISYTGYDMEDAMIINKASEERGFAHGSIYKSEFVELDHPQSYFCRDPSNEKLTHVLDSDGLPHVGAKLEPGDALFCYFSIDESRYITRKYTGKEACCVDNVRLCGSFSTQAPKVACITFRITRNPSVGDKFASRAGQKGICSQKWPTEDLPFTETGLVPDIVFNPHGFPSRMTIAMMVEIMAGKSAAVHGLVHDATPFRFDEEQTAIDYFAQLLVVGGYNYYGTETLYSGVDGREMTAQIFFGVVHYQRLRHMVSDKWQVRSTGPVDTLTRQPLKGRKRGGGVRFGEMERDALISHGAAFLLQDRLLHCSDKTTVLICTECGSLLGPMLMVTRVDNQPNLREYKEICRLCGKSDNVMKIQIPYIFKFLVTQFASCNINVKLQCVDV